MFSQLICALQDCCSGKLRRLGISNQQIDEHAARDLSGFVSKAKALKKLDLSYSSITNFSAFIDLLQVIAQENNTIQYLNIGGISYRGPAFDAEREAIQRRYVEALAALVQGSRTLVHLNLSGCFPGM